MHVRVTMLDVCYQGNEGRVVEKLMPHAATSLRLLAGGDRKKTKQFSKPVILI